MTPTPTVITASSILTDLGPYAVLIALMNAVIVYRANPLRATNVIFSMCCLLIALWQTVVTIARVSHNPFYWAPFAIPFAPCFSFLVFYLLDAALYPHATLKERVLRNTFAIFSGITAALGAVLALLTDTVPNFYPLSFRILACICFIAALTEAKKRRWNALTANPYEVLIFHNTVTILIVTYSCVLFIRRPIGSRINSIIIIGYLTFTLWAFLSEKALDSNRAAKLFAGEVLTIFIGTLVTIAALYGFAAIGALDEVPNPLVIVGLNISCYLLYKHIWPVFEKSFQSISRKTIEESRARIITLTHIAETENEMITGVEGVITHFMPGEKPKLAYRLEAFDPKTQSLIHKTKPNSWLTPEAALRRFKSPQLEDILTTFAEQKIGLIIRHTQTNIEGYLIISQRAGGSKTITLDEIQFLREIIIFSTSTVARIRASEASWRARSLATVGRIAANYSHEARNQIAAITAVTEALVNNEEKDITLEHRIAVHEQAIALAESHSFALEVARLRPGGVTMRTSCLNTTLAGATPLYLPLLKRYKGTLDQRVDENIYFVGDEKILRQVLLNLIQNTIQAANTQRKAPHITITAWDEPETAVLEISDDGPGISNEMLNQLFTPWKTTKEDGTGLGLTFCKEALNVMKGDIIHIPTTVGARFRILLSKPTNTPPAQTLSFPEVGVIVSSNS